MFDLRVTKGYIGRSQTPIHWFLKFPFATLRAMVAKTLQQLIDDRGLSLRELCKLAGVTPLGLRKIRRGEVASVRVTTANKLAKALRVSVKVLRASLPKR